MASVLDQLKSMTTVVADSGDINLIKQFHPIDATTNPSLLLKAAAMTDYQYLLKKSISEARQQARWDVTSICDHLAVHFGCEILALIPGRVSTEVDARLSFDTQATINKARQLIKLYESNGISRDRILIKIASTWEGIQAAGVLEKEGIRCNLTLLFSFTQAVACANVGVFLISPFVGRILDWYKAKTPDQDFSGLNDPGVVSVTQIYNYYKHFDIATIVMGASFRTIDEIECLAGCDRLTISPALLGELANKDAPLRRRLSPTNSSEFDQPLELSETDYRWQLNDNAMATEKLAEGIRNFAKDQSALEAMIKHLL